MNSKAATAENFLMLAILSAYPVLLLVMRGSMGALFFLMAALSVLSLARSGAWLEKANWDTGAVAYALAMASAAAVILPAQIYHHDIQWKPYDEAARLLLAVPVFMAVRAGNTAVTQVLGLSLPAGAILAMIVVGGDPDGAGRLGAYFLNVIHFGNLALMLGFLSLFSIHAGVERSPVSITLKLCGLLAGIYLSLRSGTRGGWLVIPLLLVLWIVLGQRLKSRTGVLAAFGLIAMVGVASFFMFDLILQRALEVESDLAAFARGNKDTSLGLRMQILQVVAHILQENPLFGAGPQGYKATLSALAQAGTITGAAVNLGTAEVHNQILSYAVKYGLPGLLSGLAIHLVPLVIFVRARNTADAEARTAALMGICLVTGFFIFGLSVEILNLKHTVTFYSLTLAVLLGAATRRDRQSVIH
jgi:O-antigen ligase